MWFDVSVTELPGKPVARLDLQVGGGGKSHLWGRKLNIRKIW